MFVLISSPYQLIMSGEWNIFGASAAGTAAFGTVLGAIVFVLRRVNHRRCRSRCCGFVGEAELDIGLTPSAAREMAAAATAVALPSPPRVSATAVQTSVPAAPGTPVSVPGFDSAVP